MLVFAAAKVGIFFEIKKGNRKIVLNKRCVPLRYKVQDYGHLFFQKTNPPFTRQSDP